MQAIAVPLHEIIVDNALQVRDALDRAVIDQYADVFDRLPAVVVFDTEDGLLLADGFHRMAAARKLERTHIDAIIRDGSRVDAEDWAASANATAGKPLTPGERRKAIIGYHERHPDWSLRQIGDAMSVSQVNVKNVIDAETVRRAVPAVKYLTADKKFIKEGHLREIAAAPQELWEPLVKEAEENKWRVKETQAQVQQVNAVHAAPPEAQEPLRQIAKEKQWTPDETKQAADNLTDARIPQAHKDRILAGEASPVVVTDDGRITVSQTTRIDAVKEAKANDPLLAFGRALSAISDVETQWDAATIAGEMNAEERVHYRSQLRHYISTLQAVLTAIDQPVLELVR